jgi:ADP-ribosylglycohydrolase
MIGAILGDIIGSRYEFNNTLKYNFPLFGNGCSFTDDTVCTVAIADAILSGVSYKEKLLEWCNRYPVVQGSYGGRFNAWIHSEDPQPYNSFGNGSAMRVSPVAWAYDDLEDVKREAANTASCTHNHPEGIKGAVAVAHAIWWFRKEYKQPQSLKEILQVRRGFIEAMDQYYPGFSTRKYTKGVFDETCQGTVPLCLQIIAGATGFVDAIRLAISHGGDSDTIGAIVGSIAEARWGVPDKIYAQTLCYLDYEMFEIIRRFNDMCNKVKQK